MAEEAKKQSPFDVHSERNLGAWKQIRLLEPPSQSPLIFEGKKTVGIGVKKVTLLKERQCGPATALSTILFAHILGSPMNLISKIRKLGSERFMGVPEARAGSQLPLDFAGATS